jgi:S1-C subfamily serine protease
MNRYLPALCFGSALVGGLAALAVREAAWLNVLPAQEFNAPTRLPPDPGRNTTFVDPNAAQFHGTLPGTAEPGEAELTAEERVNIAVYENVNRSVVNINTKGVRGESFFLIEIPSEGAGSGSVLDKQGHILTNYHVIEGAREIQVTLFDGKEYRAELVGEDPSTDVAVIRIQAPAAALYPVVLGDSTRLKVGQRVFAIGNPFGLERTLTTGIISSLNRSLPSRNGRTIKSIIQIDAAINPGNSGGPLLDSHSRLIGMNTAIASRTGQNTGVGFAIPVTSIGRVVPQLIERGRVLRPEIGIVRVYQTERGLLIATLAQGGPAEAAGLRGPRLVRERRRQGPFTYEYQSLDRTAADLIIAVDGEKIVSADEFLSAIESKRPGDEVTLTVVRDGHETPVRVRLGESSE